MFKLVNQFKFGAKIVKIFNTAKFLSIFFALSKKKSNFAPFF